MQYLKHQELNNLLNSANEVNLKNMMMFIEPLQELHTKEEAVKYSKMLLNKEKQKIKRMSDIYWHFFK